MNASKFMDKQIMELSGSSQPTGELLDLINPQEESHSNGAAGGGIIRIEEQQREAEILPSYDFHPIRAVGSTLAPTTGGGGGLSGSLPSWNSLDSKLASSNLKNAGILNPHESTKVSHEMEKKPYDNAVVAEIDSTVKKYADNLMNAMEVLSSRLSKLESRTHHLESSVDAFKVAIGNNNGSTDGRLRQIENILKEVHSDVQNLQDKQNSIEEQLRLGQLKASEGQQHQQQPENSKTAQPYPAQQHEALPPQNPVQQPYQHLVPQAQLTIHPPMPMPMPMPNAPPAVPQQNPSPKQPSQVSQSQGFPAGESYFPSVQQAETINPQYQVHAQPPQATPPPPPQLHHYHASQPPQYLQPPQPQQPTNPPPQLPPAMPQNPEESLSYAPGSQNYPPSMRQPASFPQQPNAPQQIYGTNANMYEPPSSKLNTGLPPFSSSYGPPPVGSNYSDSYAYSGLPSVQNRAGMKPLASSVPSGGSSNYPQLPTAQILPQAAPSGSNSGGSPGTRVPIDDVVEKVATMGFSRDQVRATVRKLTENGQSVDLNVVLDKLMNDGEIQPQKGWFGR